MIPVVRTGNFTTVNLVSKIDNFINSDFFFNDNGFEISAPVLLARCQNNPELSAKVQQMIIENDVQGMSNDMSNEDVLKTVDLKYNTITYLRDKIDKRIIELRSKPETKVAS